MCRFDCINFDYLCDLGMILTFGTHVASFNHIAECIYQLWVHRLQKFLKKKIIIINKVAMPWIRSNLDILSTQGHVTLRIIPYGRISNY